MAKVEGLPKDAYQMVPRLNILKPGPGYNPDLGAHRLDHKILGPKKEPVEHDDEKSKKIVENLQLGTRFSRDVALDYNNPRQTFPSYTASEDVITPFQVPALSPFKGSDYYLMQQVALVQSSRANFVQEENKYNTTYPHNAQATGLGPHLTPEAESISEKLYRKDLELQAEHDRTSVI